MSIEAINWAREIQLTPAEKSVLMALALCANGDGIAFPSLAYLEKLTCFSIRTIRDAKKKLLQKGLIKTVKFMRTYDVKLCLEKDFSKEIIPTIKPAAHSTKPAALADNAAPAADNDDLENHHKKPAALADEPAALAAVPERQLKTIKDNTIPYNPLSKKSSSKTEKEKVDIPDWMPHDAWHGWLEMRTKKKTPNTPRAKNRAIKKLAGFYEIGYDVGEILDTSTFNGWKDVYEPKQKKEQKSYGVFDCTDSELINSNNKTKDDENLMFDHEYPKMIGTF